MLQLVGRDSIYTDPLESSFMVMHDNFASSDATGAIKPKHNSDSSWSHV